MIDPKEHQYHDDPAEGHPDVRTRLEDACYFFIGNGLIQAAVQLAPAGEGSPYGLLIQNPDHLTAKRDTLTCDPEVGLAPTMLRIMIDGHEARHEEVRAEWADVQGVPAVAVTWNVSGVAERFFCPDRESPALARTVDLANRSGRRLAVTIRTGVCGHDIERRLELAPGATGTIILRYALGADRRQVLIEPVSEVPVRTSALAHVAERTETKTGIASLDHLYLAAVSQLSAVITADGRVDAAIWQYTREWVRDHSFMAWGLLLGGHHAAARTLAERLVMVRRGGRFDVRLERTAGLRRGRTGPERHPAHAAP